ncbi:hypothetical protein JQX13_17405 [Archangium violaceum]|uniref:hypothetical protein n=1 Tax=Archangium violaceum TaxID=83451 RepID=UPI00193BDACC|nr:hypothetical protein [Archangium violaceum]QRK11684.1 hypothetical protein JQX13_17405 [Archangium violaceum]
MAENKGPADRGIEKNPQLNKDAKELERESRHQGEGQERRDVLDSDTGEAGIQDKGIGGYGADDSSVSERRDAPPVSDNG